MMDEISKVTALVDEAISAATKALTANKDWEGTIEVRPNPDGAIAYRFGLKIPDGDIAKMAAEFQTVTDVIEQNCTMHVVRTGAMFETVSDFLNDTVWAEGCMRGHMIGVGIGKGPATRTVPPATERIVMSAGT